ncbi:hypothetical protein C8R44DRAFT_981806 [Mycena epipterygia]|nr:hypothetical protein C8R44DRAFT_981806 [Mycena epipterygia]
MAGPCGPTLTLFLASTPHDDHDADNLRAYKISLQRREHDDHQALEGHNLCVYNLHGTTTRTHALPTWASLIPPLSCAHTTNIRTNTTLRRPTTSGEIRVIAVLRSCYETGFPSHRICAGALPPQMLVPPETATHDAGTTTTMTRIVKRTIFALPSCYDDKHAHAQGGQRAMDDGGEERGQPC